MDFEEYLREDEAKFSNFDEYIRVSEPHTRERACAWKAAIGLQSVDGLHVSEYLKETALRHIEGEISIDDARDLVRGYYQTRTARIPDDSEAQEADKVAVNITKLLSEQSFSFSVPGFVATHRRIFDGVFDHAGTLREFDITKKEWVLRGDTVLYVSCEELVRTLEYDIVQERKFSYAGLNMNETILHLAKFVSGLWQIHPFCEGNTRTTAIFIIKYLRSIGFEADNTLFERHSWYFRNALVRANYRNVKKGITPNFEFLIRFFRNLLVGEKNELRNRHLLLRPAKNSYYEWDGFSTEEWIEILSSEKITTPTCLKILESVYFAKDFRLNAKKVASKIGYEHFLPVNKLVGEWGKRIHQKMGIANPPCRKNGKIRWWSIVFDGEDCPPLYYWIVKPRMLDAIEKMGLFVPSKKEVFSEAKEIDEAVLRKGEDRLGLVKQRLGQSSLRKAVLRTQRRCSLCGLDFTNLLIVSHIKPWCESLEDEKVDLENILLLCPNHDALFDKHLISFDDDGKIIISPVLDEQCQKLLNIHHGMKIPISEKMRSFMRIHRENFETNL